MFFGIIETLGNICFSPGRGILWSFGSVEDGIVLDFKEDIGVRGGGAIVGVRLDVTFVFS